MKKFLSALVITFIIWTDGYPQTDPDNRIADPVLLENFFDGLMNDHLRSKHVAGAVVAVVKDGNFVFTKGYGYSDYASKRPVSPDSTLFRIGSISKTFTWTAVMQLVEQGKLKLDEDVNAYLSDFKIPEGEGGPVTLRHLMTHTPGFEDRLIGIFAKDEKALRPYGEILKIQLPEPVRPAGVEMQYSNHGAGIAAYIVEQASGLSWDEYVERNFTLVYWPAVYLIRRKYTLNPGVRITLPARNKWLGWLTSFLVLFFFIGFMAALSKPWEIVYGVPPAIKVKLIIPIVLYVFLLLSIYQAYKLTISKEYNLSGKIHFYTLAFALLLLLWQLNHWNLLGFKY